MSNYLEQWLQLSPGLLLSATEAYSGRHGQPDTICPAPSDVFRAFEYFAPEDTRVVILGQDPYHSTQVLEKNGWWFSETARKASGLAFAYHKDWTGPVDSSLQNIIGELGIIPDRFSTRFLSLESWAEQGVLLLNTKLTVQSGKPLSHSSEEIGWEQATTKLIQELDKLNGRDLVWLLWGQEAQHLFDKAMGTSKREDVAAWGHVIRTSHPCKFSNTKGEHPFTGSRCFDRVNDCLGELGYETINWV